jgi:hypothetical protein
MSLRAWIGKLPEVSNLVTKGEEPIRIRQADYEKIIELKDEIGRAYNIKITTTKLFNCLIYLFGFGSKSTRH